MVAAELRVSSRGGVGHRRDALPITYMQIIILLPIVRRWKLAAAQ